MNKTKIIALAATALIAATTHARTVTISKTALQDKIKGGWAGQTIGCAYGGPTEFKYQSRMISDDTPIVWDDTRIKYYFDNFPGLYDDIYMDLTFVDVFEKKGLDAPVTEFSHAFAHARYQLWHANQSARYNILNGVGAPASGYWKNNPHADDIDFQIEADYAGLMTPGMPLAAAHYADGIGHMMNYGDGWYGGVYVATMYSLAFVSEDVNYIVTEALKAIPQQSTFYQCVAYTIAQCKANKDWKDTWKAVENKYGTTDLCPDGVLAPFNIDAKINSAYIVIGMLYGGGDFGKTMEITARCGQDSDCNPSSAGGILGAMMGYSNIPAYWKGALKGVEDINFKYTEISLNKVYGLGMKHALQVVARNGGKVTGNSVKIKTQAVLSVRFEQSFEGLVLGEKKGLGNKPLDKMGTFKFTGSGIVICGRVKADDKDYVALLEVVVDGKKMPIMKLPVSENARANELYWNFNLEEGEHTITLKCLNPQDNVTTDAYCYITFHKAE